MVSQLAHRIANPDRFAARLANDFAIGCIQIAKASHLDGTARLVSLRTATSEFVVPSRNRSAQHTVICDFCGSLWCDCPSGARFNRACSHAGAAILYVRTIAKACTSYAENTEASGARAGPDDEAMAVAARSGGSQVASGRQL